MRNFLSGLFSFVAMIVLVFVACLVIVSIVMVAVFVPAAVLSYLITGEADCAMRHCVKVIP